MDVGDDQVETKGHSYGDIYPESDERIQVATNKNDIFYKTDHKRRGIAVIFNHENFTTNKQRHGTEKDCFELEKTLKSMGFETRKYKDLTVKEVDAVLEALSNEDFTDCDCVFISILSHGEKGVIFAKDYAYSHNMLFDRFTPDRCPTLAGKPKIYVIQACQGHLYDPGVKVRTVQVDSDSYTTYSIPLYADFLVAYSTIPGYYSWRNSKKGSYFIQALCEELRTQWQNSDFLTILTFVNSRVAFDFESNVPDEPLQHKKKQIPSFTSMLTRILKFAPKQVEQNGACNNTL